MIRPAGWLLLAVLTLLAVIIPFLSRDPLAQGNLLTEALLPPSAAHWLGTDQFARDVLARLAHGARITIGVAFGAVAGSALIAIPTGMAAGLAPAPLAFALGRLIDLALALPRVIVLLAMVAALGVVSPTGLTLLLALTGWPAMARLVRGETLRIRELPYVTAAAALGAAPARVALRHILPALLPTALVAMALAVADVMLLEAGLSFLGLGTRPPAPTWGGMLLEARSHISHAPWLLLAPGTALAMTTAAATMIADDLRRGMGKR